MSARFPLALFGHETRYVTRLYLLRTLAALLVILSVVLALDLATRFDQVIAARGPVEVPQGIERLLYYALLRAAYNMPAILPLATAIGIVWAEFKLVRGHERAMIANTGRAPALSLVPAVIIGLLVGALQSVLLADLRPWSVEAQGTAGFRDYGARFTGATVAPKWLLVDGRILRSSIRFAPTGPVLTDLRIFEFDERDRLSQMIWAEEGHPSDQGLALSGARAAWPAEQASDRVQMALDPDWLAYAGVEPRFIPRATLERIATARGGVPEQAAYRAAMNDRRAAIGMGLAMAVAVAALCLFTLSERRGLATPFVILGAAYAMHVAQNVLSVLGEFQHLGPHLSAWALPGLVLTATAAMVAWRAWSVARALS